MAEAKPSPGPDFVRTIVAADNESGKWNGRVITRFPPEPNGYLHIGHAKSIALNFGIAEENNGICHLRFDDTNPIKEEQEYIESIKRDVSWLGYKWAEHEYFASNYFDQLYAWAVQLIEKGKAFVCQLDSEQMRQYRGTLTEPGKNSPWRDRPVKESLELFEKMKNGEVEEGSHTLRAKIDMAHPNLNMRDPVMYRILKASHHRTGDKWCVYPMYDFAHGQSDSIEKVTHSICTLEFEDHRPLYDWYLEQLDAYHPQQIEFARLNLTYTILSKRRLIELVKEGFVSGWDDPRMPTISGMRRRGYPPEAIRAFCRGIGVSKTGSTVDIALLEHHVREHLNRYAQRRYAVLDPIKVVIENYPEDKVEQLECINNPEDPDGGTRMIDFCREIYVERADFMEDPPRKFFRLSPGREVRLRYAYFITCNEVIKDPESGEIVELRCSYDPETRGGDSPDGRRVKGTIHWVSARHSLQAEIRLYDRLFSCEYPGDVGEDEDWKDNFNHDSYSVLSGSRVEPSMIDSKPGETVQFERKGYFRLDEDSSEGALVFNRTVGLRDSWAKIAKQQKKK